MGFPLSRKKWMLDIKKAAYPADEYSPVCHVLKKTLHLFSPDKA
jgi:hypothetical protein